MIVFDVLLQKRACAAVFDKLQSDRYSAPNCIGVFSV